MELPAFASRELPPMNDGSCVRLRSNRRNHAMELRLRGRPYLRWNAYSDADDLRLCPLYDSAHQHAFLVATAGNREAHTDQTAQKERFTRDGLNEEAHLFSEDSFSHGKKVHQNCKSRG